MEKRCRALEHEKESRRAIAKGYASLGGGEYYASLGG